MKKLIYISLISFLLLSCTKGGGNVYIEGRVYNPITGDGIEGAEIILYRDKLGGAVAAQSGGSKIVENVKSDVNGNYKIKHAGIADYTAKMYSLGNYEAIGWVNIHSKNKTYNAAGQGTFDVKLSKNMHADFQAVSYGYLKLSIHNVNCQGLEDKMRFRFQTTVENSFESWTPYREGCYSFDGSEFIKVPMGWRIYEWEVTKNGVTNYFSDSVYVAENQNNTFVINY